MGFTGANMCIVICENHCVYCVGRLLFRQPVDQSVSLNDIWFVVLEF